MPALGGVSAPRGSAPRGCLLREGGLLRGGAATGGPAPGGCLVETQPPPGTATAAGGTHPLECILILRKVPLTTISVTSRFLQSIMVDIKMSASSLQEAIYFGSVY